MNSIDSSAVFIFNTKKESWPIFHICSRYFRNSFLMLFIKNRQTRQFCILPWRWESSKNFSQTAKQKVSLTKVAAITKYSWQNADNSKIDYFKTVDFMDRVSYRICARLIKQITHQINDLRSFDKRNFSHVIRKKKWFETISVALAIYVNYLWFTCSLSLSVTTATSWMNPAHFKMIRIASTLHMNIVSLSCMNCQILVLSMKITFLSTLLFAYDHHFGTESQI